MNETLDRFEELLLIELNKINEKGDISPTELENASKVICLLEKIKEINMGDTGASYRRGRDSMTGRYVSRNAQDYSNDGRMSNRYMSNRSYERGYSGHSIKDRMIDHLESMMDEAKTDYERQTVRDWIERLEMEK